MLATAPNAMLLRYLGTLTEIGSDKNSTIVFPVPVDLARMVGALVDRSDPK